MGIVPLLKQEDKLTREDLERNPVWMTVHGEDEGEKWYSRCDEATVRPWDGSLPVSLDEERRSILVAAEFFTRVGRRLDGAVQAVGLEMAHETSARIVAETQPRVFLSGGIFYFWGGRLGTELAVQARFLSLLEEEETTVFPLRFVVRNGLITGLESGVVEGFYRLVSDDEPGLDLGQVSPVNNSTGLGELVQGGRWEEALALATAEVQAHPDDPELRRRRSYVHAAQGDLQAALGDALGAVELYRDRQDLYPLVCSYLLRLQQFGSCIEYAGVGLSAMMRDPRTAAMLDSQLRFLRARALFGVGRAEEALVELANLPDNFSMRCAGVSLMTRRSLLRACGSAVGRRARKR